MSPKASKPVKTNIPDIALWEQLFALMARIKALAPWEWMEETDIFGVQYPDAGNLGFVSIMGMAGEHYSVGVYLGALGLAGFWEMQDNAPFVEPERLLEIPQLQASFEDRDQLDKKDRDLIKSLNLKFRGQHAWPQFRSYRPGMFPWYLELPEAQFLGCVLEQVLDVAPRFRDNPALLEMSEDETYLVRVRRPDGAAWEDQALRIQPPPPVAILVTMDRTLVEQVQRLPQSRHRLEIDVFMVPSPVQDERGARPYFPYMLLAVEQHSGMILGTELLKPEPTLEAMWGQVPVKIVQQLVRLGTIPQEVHVRSPLLLQLFQPLAETVGFKLKQSNRLRQVDAAKNSLTRFML